MSDLDSIASQIPFCPLARGLSLRLSACLPIITSSTSSRRSILQTTLPSAYKQRPRISGIRAICLRRSPRRLDDTVSREDSTTAQLIFRSPISQTHPGISISQGISRNRVRIILWAIHKAALSLTFCWGFQQMARSSSHSAFTNTSTTGERTRSEEHTSELQSL